MSALDKILRLTKLDRSAESLVRLTTASKRDRYGQFGTHNVDFTPGGMPAPPPGAAVYKHPQGATIYVLPDGTMQAYNKLGQKKSTSATPEKLAAGHGSWQRTEAAEVSIAAPVALREAVSSSKITVVKPTKAAEVIVKAPEEVEVKSLDAPELVTKTKGVVTEPPMLMDQVATSDVPKYAADNNWAFQQKVDGIRGQLVIEAGKAPWFRSKSGGLLQSSTAAKISEPLVKALGIAPAGTPTHVIDGELLNGNYHVFDMVVHGSEAIPWEKRMAMAEAWTAQMQAAGLKQIKSIPVARTQSEKLALWDAVGKSGAEGVVMKRIDAPYSPGKRVQHTLKAKIFATADVVVMGKGQGAKGGANFQFGIYHEGKLVPIGGATGIGVEKALGEINVGDVVEVKYLWANPATHSLQIPNIIKLRPDKPPEEATTDQLRYVDKTVLDASVMKP